ncbi:ribose 5-phosphate isomerase B [Mesomycoplasma lagogenitalium]|uniref:Ribose 5-phosphate isomerase B n=1 Tax=Mesomycoplasma lagogenitalium TaxID=171286 RepID=A0ABY8LU89_9BACT|nr:ribose 5-phosphate isomerase B [Mesomycoplasma lagogenitalium]WGI36799.1 ribose 5-phosphate isomerase B [Mesomycoplasma lagogenitalium]
MKKLKIAFASDHAGYALKSQILEYIKSKGYEVEDLGPFNDKESVSYAEYGKKLAKHLQNKKADLGVGFCGTGLGISYALNRFKGIRAARITNVNDAYLAKLHNNANVIAMSGRFTTFEEAKKMVDEFFETKYEGGRHQTRIDQLDEVGQD